MCISPIHETSCSKHSSHHPRSSCMTKNAIKKKNSKKILSRCSTNLKGNSIPEICTNYNWLSKTLHTSMYSKQPAPALHPDTVTVMNALTHRRQQKQQTCDKTTHVLQELHPQAGSEFKTTTSFYSVGSLCRNRTTRKDSFNRTRLFPGPLY